MKKVVILQKYLAPYRVPVFNGIARHPAVDLTLLYYGKIESRRKWSAFGGREFAEVQANCISLHSGYESNVEIPFSLLQNLADIRPDVIICAPDIGGIAAAMYARKAGVGIYIWSEATPETEQKVSPLKRYLRRTLYGQAAGFLVPGSLTELYIRQYQPTAEVFRVPNAIDENRFSISREQLSAKFGSARLVITFSGSLVGRKGIILLLEAFRQLLQEQPPLREDCLLRVMGTGPLDLDCYRADAVMFAGFCENETYWTYFKESHIFVLPSLRDNNPLTVVEGLYSGNVLLLTDGVGNHPEAVRGNGLVVPANSVDELKRGLATLLALPRAKLLQMAARSVAIAPEFSVTRSVDSFLAAIHAIDADSAASRRER